MLLAACSSAPDTSEVFKVDGKALRGYDAVAFHLDQKPTEGNQQYAYQWNDATWLFANQAHLDSFKVNPERYAPQYGGYCAFGTADGHKAPTEINTWTLLDGKLYFNYNSEVKTMWDKDRAGFIQKADSLWPNVKDDEF